MLNFQSSNNLHQRKPYLQEQLPILNKGTSFSGAYQNQQHYFSESGFLPELPKYVQLNINYNLHPGQKFSGAPAPIWPIQNENPAFGAFKKATAYGPEMPLASQIQYGQASDRSAYGGNLLSGYGFEKPIAPSQGFASERKLLESSQRSLRPVKEDAYFLPKPVGNSMQYIDEDPSTHYEKKRMYKRTARSVINNSYDALPGPYMSQNGSVLDETINKPQFLTAQKTTAALLKKNIFKNIINSREDSRQEQSYSQMMLAQPLHGAAENAYRKVQSLVELKNQKLKQIVANNNETGTERFGTIKIRDLLSQQENSSREGSALSIVKFERIENKEREEVQSREKSIHDQIFGRKVLKKPLVETNKAAQDNRSESDSPTIEGIDEYKLTRTASNGTLKNKPILRQRDDSSPGTRKVRFLLSRRSSSRPRTRNQEENNNNPGFEEAKLEGTNYYY